MQVKACAHCCVPLCSRRHAAYKTRSVILKPKAKSKCHPSPIQNSISQSTNPAVFWRSADVSKPASELKRDQGVKKKQKKNIRTNPFILSPHRAALTLPHWCRGANAANSVRSGANSTLLFSITNICSETILASSSFASHQDSSCLHV